MHPVMLGRREFLHGACAVSARLIALATGGLGLISPSWSQSTAPGSKRLICVGGALTEIIYALGLEEHLMAVDTTSTYPVMTKHLPSVGYARSLSLEGVLSMRPKLLLVTEDAGPPQVLRRISQAGIQVRVLKADHRYQGLRDRVKTVGHVMGAEYQAEQLIKDIDSRWQIYQKELSHLRPTKNNSSIHRQPTGKKLKAMFILAHSPQQVMVAGDNTSAHAIMNYLNLENAFKTLQGYKPLTPESIIAGEADIILLTDQGLQVHGGLNGVLRLPGVMQTPAAKHRQIYSREANHLLGFGPRLPSMLSSLAKEIYKVT